MTPTSIDQKLTFLYSTENYLGAKAILYSEPSMLSDVCATIDNETPMYVVDELIHADGFDWYAVCFTCAGNFYVGYIQAELTKEGTIIRKST